MHGCSLHGVSRALYPIIEGVISCVAFTLVVRGTCDVSCRKKTLHPAWFGFAPDTKALFFFFIDTTPHFSTSFLSPASLDALFLFPVVVTFAYGQICADPGLCTRVLEGRFVPGLSQISERDPPPEDADLGQVRKIECLSSFFSHRCGLRHRGSAL